MGGPSTHLFAADGRRFESRPPDSSTAGLASARLVSLSCEGACLIAREKHAKHPESQGVRNDYQIALKVMVETGNDTTVE
jgi:hypothetical protein